MTPTTAAVTAYIAADMALLARSGSIKGAARNI
jgi:hypothetical protein